MVDSNLRRIAVIGMTSNKGGIESVIMNIYRNIDRTKVQFDFLVPYNMGQMAYEEEVLTMGARIFKILYPQKKHPIKSQSELTKYFKENPEVKGVHLHVNYPYILPLKVAKKNGISIRIIHAHSSALLFESKEGLDNMVKGIRNKLICNQIKKYSNVNLSCSDLASKSTFNNEQYIWFKNGVDILKYKYDECIRNEIRKINNIQQNEHVIGFVGRLCEIKNSMYILDIFIEYLKINPNSKLIFVGDGELRRNIESKIGENNIQDKVIIVGNVPDTYKWYQSFDFFLLPSLFEGFPVVLVEAQVAGLPCLVSDTVTKQAKLTELIDYKSIDVPAKQWATEIHQKINLFKDRNKYAEELKKQGFDENDMANQVMKYYCGENI